MGLEKSSMIEYPETIGSILSTKKCISDNLTLL